MAGPEKTARMPSTPPVAAHFTKSAAGVRETYDAVLTAARGLGPVREEAKKTSIHLVRSSAFAGVAPRRQGLILPLKASKKIESSRVPRAEQPSASRCHLAIAANIHEMPSCATRSAALMRFS